MRYSKLWVSLLLGTILGLGWGGCSPDPNNNEDDPCEGIDCSGHGICDEQEGEPVCICETDYEADGTECVALPEGCTASTCSGHGDCDDASGEPVCACDEGYTGDRCDECEEGFHHEGGPSGGVGECVPDVDPCDPDPCDTASCGNGSCACVGGEAICACDEGWAGELCDECDDDYYLYDDDCIPCNEIEFSFTPDPPADETVWLTGDWVGTEPDYWAETPAAGAIEMTDDGTGTWTALVTIETGGAHEYKYIVDEDEWQLDPSEPTVGEGVFVNNVVDVCVFGGGEGGCGDVAVSDWRDVVMYFVMVDRFNDSDGERETVPDATDGPADGPSGQYMGGDLAGVTEQLGYLTDLGVTALWLSAPYENRDEAGEAINPDADSHMYSAYHGYWPSPADVDYSDPTSPSPRPMVESRIGTEADLRELIDIAHATTGAHGDSLRVLFDYVMNHVDENSGLYAAHSDVSDRTNDWFARDESDNQFRLCGPENLWDDDFWGTRCAFTEYLPPFDFARSSEALQWSVDDALWWALEYGIDGYRLDAIKHVPFEWLTALRDELTTQITAPWGDRFYLVGETFAYTNPGLIRDYVDPDTMLDGQFDFPFKYQLCRAVFNQADGLDTFSTWMDGNDIFYGPDAIMTTWIGNHDIPRAIHFASGQIGNCREGSSPGNGWNADAYQQPTDAAPYERLGVAFAIMMTNRGIPLIYYGDEIGLAGGGDPDNRRMMVFDRLNDHQLALRDAVSALANARAENPALSRGRRTTHSVSADSWVYTMGGCGDTPDVTVAINRADGDTSVTIPAGDYTDLIHDGAHSGGSATLAPRSFLLLRHE